MNSELLDELSTLEAATFEIEDVDALDRTPAISASCNTSCVGTATSCAGDPGVNV